MRTKAVSVPGIRRQEPQDGSCMRVSCLVPTGLSSRMGQRSMSLKTIKAEKTILDVGKVRNASHGFRRYSESEEAQENMGQRLEGMGTRIEKAHARVNITTVT